MSVDQRAVFGGQVTERTSAEWYTPPSIFEALGLRFDLDPASPEAGPVPWVPADRFMSPTDNVDDVWSRQRRAS